MRTVGQFLESSDWNDGEKWVIKWQFRLLGDFETALAEALCRADEDNLIKLSLGFPSQVQGFLSWNRRGLGQRLREAGLDI
jgi:hypothetical protein